MKETENTVASEVRVGMRAGFTLMEILVAVAIIGILGTVAVQSVTSNIEKARETAAQDAVNSIKNACVTYSNTHKKYPNDLKDLIKEEGDEEAILSGGEGALEDPWGNEYKYEKKGKKIVVISAGPDGEFGNDDDLRSDKIKKSKKN